ncbi:MAG TPA: 23S rRNA (guanosine(2251)-2'-O)-methyltransferase RlmB [Streptosporangiaceae bacterium]|nr:23S rRNA (guanosine(2251)-2'-O)-methyltransferase RlmB [Streptosporangiaceae bacterium]
MTGNEAGGSARSGRGGRTKSGKPRPGTGGYGKRRLEGKGPTPPAHLRPGHPAQRRAAAQAARSQRGGQQSDRAGRAGGRSVDGTGPGLGSRDQGYPDAAPWAGAPRAGASRAGASRAGSPGTGASRERARGAGDAAEVVAGRNPVLESLRARVPATALYAGPRLDSDPRVTELIRLAADAGIPMIEAGRPELDRLTGGAVHQGVALKIRPYDYAHPDDLIERARAMGEPPLIVALDAVTDPRNLGAIVRSVAAFGGHGVLVPARRSAHVSAGAWKASAGALARVPVAWAPNLARALTSYQEAGLFVAGLDAQGETAVGELEVADQPLVLVVGSEGRGLSRLVAQRCDVLVRIPIAAQTESLNAGVAAGIALHEVATRRSA